MVFLTCSLSCSGTGGGIYANLANGVPGHNCSRVFQNGDSLPVLA
jgi:hypothetical protein